jgi:Ca2+-binding EF-hand superfamily protein
MCNLFYSDYHSLIKLIFKIYDFDKNGLISKEDIRIVLLYIPLNITALGKYMEKYEDRLEAQNELIMILDKVFGEIKYVDITEFCEIVENHSSEILIYVALINSAPSVSIRKETFPQ